MEHEFKVGDRVIINTMDSILDGSKGVIENIHTHYKRYNSKASIYYNVLVDHNTQYYDLICDEITIDKQWLREKRLDKILG